MFGEASGKGLISIEDWSLWRIEACLERARGIFEARRRGEPIPYKVEGKTLATLFYEPSTRTRVSFELAAQELGMKVLSIQAAASSVIKGESLLDSVRTLEAMGVDVIVLRHPLSGAPAFVAGHSRAAIINAGDGMHEHPTQALLDAFTVWRAKGRIQGLTVAICGDVLHSRVARSDALLFSRFGCEVRFVGPLALLPRNPSALGARCFSDMREGLAGADVVIALRLQKERMDSELVPSLAEYAKRYGINSASLALAKPDAVVLHPGPMHRGVEISEEVIESERALIFTQVEAGVAVRMALLMDVVGE